MYVIPNYHVNHVTSRDQLNDRCLLFASRACLPCSISEMIAIEHYFEMVGQTKPFTPKTQNTVQLTNKFTKNACCLACLNTFQA